MSWEAKGLRRFTHGTRDELLVPRKDQTCPRWCPDTCHTLKVRYNTYPGATTTHTATPLRHKNQTTWSLPSTDNSNTAEQLSLSRLILEEEILQMVFCLLHIPESLKVYRPPDYLNSPICCDCYFTDFDMTKPRFVDGGREQGRAKSSTAFKTIKHFLSCLERFV